jgi:methionine-gamma-lyase
MSDHDRHRLAQGFSTRAIRAATTAPHVDQRPNAVPIYQSATFSAATAAELGAVTTNATPGYAYSRLDNPTTVALADAIAELEEAEAGYVLASGMAAIHAALLSIISAGDRVVATRRSTAPPALSSIGSSRLVAVDYVDRRSCRRRATVAAARPACTSRRSQPDDRRRRHRLARRHRPSPRQRPDRRPRSRRRTSAVPSRSGPTSSSSATKFLSGHSDVLAGAVVGSRERVTRVRSVQVDTGATLAPLSAFLVLRGLPTLAIRMERHSATSLALATWLEAQPGVARVYHPFLPSHPQHELARRQFTLGGGMMAIELAGGRVAGEAFIDA